MAQHPDVKFPWKDFAVWLREGITAARILNKFMIASWPEEHRRERGVSLTPVPVRREETELLRAVEARGSGARGGAVTTTSPRLWHEAQSLLSEWHSRHHNRSA
jgi:hypothetical protein